MAQSVVRIGDTAVGYCSGPGHPPNRAFTGVWTAGSSTVLADGIGVVRAGDHGVTDCSHTMIASNGSSISTADGLAVHRVGDVLIIAENGVGVSTSGSPTVTSD